MSEHKRHFFEHARRVLTADFSEQQVDFALTASEGLAIVFFSKPPRSSKLGDIRKSPKGDHFEISYTKPENVPERNRSYLTVLHEIAHALTYTAFNHKRIKPHGPEWKSCFGDLIQSAVYQNLFAPELAAPLLIHSENPTARAGIDNELERAFARLAGHDSPPVLEDLKQGLWFRISGGKWFCKGRLLRKNYSCTDPSGSEFHVPPSIEVLEVREDAPTIETPKVEKGTVAALETGQRFQLGGPLIYTKGPRLRKFFRCTASDGATYRVHPDAPYTRLIGDD